MNHNEIQIPVPWGIIAAKTWGIPSDPLVLCIHGWGDNANSFDRLIPLLPTSFYYICIDLPGHGRSTPVKTSLILRDIDYIVALKLVYNHLKRDKITIIAHSLGGYISLAFTQFFPECVGKIVVFDVFYFVVAPPAEQFGRLLFRYTRRINFIAKKTKNGPTYTKEEIIEKLMTARLTPLSRQAAEVLIDRCIEPADGGKYRMTTASNVNQLIFSSFSRDALLEIMQKYPIRCPHLLILSSNTSFMTVVFRKLHNEYKKNPNYEFHLVDGTHEVHLENPENVAPIVSDFLLKCPSKL